MRKSSWNSYKGDIWDLAKTHIIVISTNLQGVMGRGLAKQASDKYIDLEFWYRSTLKYWQGQELLIYKSMESHRKLAMFPVKYDWRQTANLDLMRRSAILLKRYILQNPCVRMAVPQVGCGFGELLWEDVKERLQRHLNPVKENITLVEPTPNLLSKYPKAFMAGARRDRLNA